VRLNAQAVVVDERRGARAHFVLARRERDVRVRDADGVTPVSYQPDYLDPMGRTVKLSLRKVFY